MVVENVIIAFLGVAVIFFWIAFQLKDDSRYDILKGLLICLGLMMTVLTISMTSHFIQADAELYGYDTTSSYTALKTHANTAFTITTYMLYTILAYVIIYYVFFVIFPKIMDLAMTLGLKKKSRKKRIEEGHSEDYA